MDRIDLHVEVTPVSFDEFFAIERPRVSSKDIAQRVVRTGEMQVERFKDLPTSTPTPRLQDLPDEFFYPG